MANVWNVVQMDCYPEFEGEADCVFNVHWTLTGEEDGYTGSVYGSVGVSLDPEAPFVAYADLTLEQVVGWVQDALGEEGVAAAEGNVADQIANQKNPTVVSPPLPWVPAVETPVEETAA